MASSWQRSRDAGLVGRLTVGDFTENKSREGEWKMEKTDSAPFSTGSLSKNKTKKKSGSYIHSDENALIAKIYFARSRNWIAGIRTRARTKGLCNMLENTQHHASGAAHTFPLLSHVLVRKHSAELCRQGPFFSFPVVCACVTGDLFLQFSGGTSLFPPPAIPVPH